MALNWKHIKGVYGSGANLFYSYIEFPNTSSESLHLYIGATNTIEPKNENLVDWGNLVTTGGRPQTFSKTITIPDLCVTNQLSCGSNPEYPANPKLSWDKQKFTIYGETLELKSAPQRSSTTKRVGVSIDYKKGGVIFESDNSAAKAQFNMSIQIDQGKTLNCGNSIIKSGYIEAPYFNATSDKRAKINIQPFASNALEIVNKLQTYTYNYKDSNIKSYGVMAQDLLDVDLNGFSFVENKSATGENGDYMAIHESKLVYLLLEAVKEQQQEIKKLQQQVEELLNGK